jgi:type VI secretion system protein ImpK
MGLSKLFVPMMAYVQGLERQDAPDASLVHERLQAQIKTARDEALSQSIEMQRFHDALFPVVAWIDERLSLLVQWHETKAWRVYMLQRKLFSTSLAGVQFFDRLQAIEPDDSELREVYVMCLALGFVGRYSQNPNSPELVALQQTNYQMLRPEAATDSPNGLARLFPEAYRLVTGGGVHRKWHNRSRGGWLLVVVVPVLVIAALVFWFDSQLSEKVNDITRRLL